MGRQLMILALIQNLALLASLAMGLQMLSRRLEQRPALLALITGVLFGAVGMVAMMTPLKFAPGVIYDGRSIILSLAGVFGGPLAAGVATVISGSYRLYLGGVGAAAGVTTIVESATLGVVLHYLRRRDEAWVGLLRLWAFAMLVHVLMLLAQLLIPGRGWEAILRIGPTVLICYPPCFLLIAQVFLDSERRRKTLDALSESEKTLRRIGDNLPLGFVYQVVRESDGRMRFLYLSAGAEQIYGYPVEALLKDSALFYGATVAEDQAVVTAAEAKSIRDMTVVTVEVRVRDRRNEVRTILLRSAPRRLGDGRVVWDGIATDISDRRRMEERLRQSQKMEAVGQLAGGVAHDFNNILAAILMQIGLLQEKKNLDLETREALTDLQHGAERAATLTRQLLIFSRRSVLDVKRLDLNALIENLLKMLRRLIGEHIQLTFTAATPSLRVEADAGMLEQVLVNLAVNARDAMPRGGQLWISSTRVELDHTSVQAHPQGAAGRFACLRVQDTGCGIEPALLRRIFEPFFTTKEVGKGTGLGLATVHGIVAQHHGWVEVESEVGKGSTFHVFLPEAKECQPEVGEPLTVPPTTPRGCETLLLVEDDEDVRRQLTRSLRSFGYEVLEATNGKEALLIWEKSHPHIELLLTDMLMPEGLTGLDLAREFRAKKAALKVIITSGYSPDLIPSNQGGGSQIAFLAKPYRPSVLAATVRSCLDAGSTPGG
jgi:two-component system, cell cycle sensor histidine kinase and response regulator CckA